jgi:hypothetical protein
MYTRVYDREVMAKFAASTTGMNSVRMLVPRVSGFSVVFGPLKFGAAPKNDTEMSF